MLGRRGHGGGHAAAPRQFRQIIHAARRGNGVRKTHEHRPESGCTTGSGHSRWPKLAGRGLISTQRISNHPVSLKKYGHWPANAQGRNRFQPHLPFLSVDNLECHIISSPIGPTFGETEQNDSDTQIRKRVIILSTFWLQTIVCKPIDLPYEVGIK